MAQHDNDKGFDPAAILDHVTFFRLTQSPEFIGCVKWPAWCRG